MGRDKTGVYKDDDGQIYVDTDPDDNWSGREAAEEGSTEAGYSDGSSSSGGSGGGSSDEKTVEDFDPDNYPGAKTVNELGEIRRDKYGYTEQEKDRISRGKDPVPDGGTGYVVYDPEFDGGSGEVIAQGDTRAEAADSKLQRDIEKAREEGKSHEDLKLNTDDLPFNQEMSDIQGSRAERTREKEETIRDTIENLPEGDTRLNVEGTQLADRFESDIVKASELQNELKNDAETLSQQANEYEVQQTEAQRIEEQQEALNQRNNEDLRSQFYSSNTDPTGSNVNTVPVNPETAFDSGEMAMIGPDEQPDRGDRMTLGKEVPGQTDIPGTSVWEQQRNAAEQELREGILPDSGLAGIKAGAKAEELSKITLGEAVLTEEQQRNAQGVLQDVRPFAPLGPATEDIETLTAVGVDTLKAPADTLKFADSVLQEGTDPINEALNNLDQMIGGSPEATLSEEDVTPAAVAASTPDPEMGRTPSQVKQDAGELGFLASVLSGPSVTGAPGLGVTRIPGKTSTKTKTSTPVKQRNSFSPEDIPDMDQLPEGFTVKESDPVTGLSDPVMQDTNPAPGIRGRTNTPDEEIREQTRQGTDPLRTEEGLTPTEREVLRDRLELDGTGRSTDRGTIEKMIDEFEEAINNPKGQANLFPQRRRDIETDTKDIIGQESRTIEEDLADLGEIKDPERPFTDTVDTSSTTNTLASSVLADTTTQGIEPVLFDQQGFEESLVQDQTQTQDQGISSMQEQEISTEFDVTPVQETGNQTGTATSGAGQQDPSNILDQDPFNPPQRKRTTTTGRGRTRRRPWWRLDDDEEEIEEEDELFQTVFGGGGEAFPDLFSVIEGETEARQDQTFTGFEDRVNKEIDKLL